MTGDDKALPESNAGRDGASGGALGGASTSDLKRGYSDASAADVHSDTAICNCPMCCAERVSHGFLDRPQGWER